MRHFDVTENKEPPSLIFFTHILIPAFEKEKCLAFKNALGVVSSARKTVDYIGENISLGPVLMQLNIKCIQQQSIWDDYPRRA